MRQKKWKKNRNKNIKSKKRNTIFKISEILGNLRLWSTNYRKILALGIFISAIILQIVLYGLIMVLNKIKN